MADNKPELKIAKAKVLTAEKGSYKDKDGIDRDKWTVVLQDEEDSTKVYTGGVTKGGDALEVGKTVEDIAVWKNQYGYSFTFGGGSGYKGRGGYTPVQKEDPVLKIVSFAFSYTKDIMLAEAGEYKWDDYYDRALALVGVMVEAYNTNKQRVSQS